MKIHYFQRYSSKENVATANTMLLLSRLYNYSAEKFFRFLNPFFPAESLELKLSFRQQERDPKSVPDATISQDSFKIIIETKMSGSGFDLKQLESHLSSFKGEKYKVLLTLAPEPMREEEKEKVDQIIEDYRRRHEVTLAHENMTFEKIAEAVKDVLDEFRDQEMLEILEDYSLYCIDSGLIASKDSWKTMRVQLSGKTIEYNLANDMYWDNAGRGFRPHDYLGLYNQKSVRAIGKIVARVKTIPNEKDIDDIKYESEIGELTEERKAKIKAAISYLLNKGFDLRVDSNRYFFVEKFYETDFKKTSPGAPFGSRIFDLSERLGLEKLPDTAEIAELLKEKTWI